ncbi:MAG: hypothetical protein HQ566_01600 [Candidatus Omnitrophica bacterium]|nr:hypothetical protein [Candidatus Omnitrophota bacterium]
MRRAILLIFISIFILSGTSAYAHPPSNIKVEHSSESRMLTIIVTHPVKNVEKHFIKKIDIGLNGKEILSHKIKKQDNNEYQFAVYMIPDAKIVDRITVEAYCSISGKLKKEIDVK